MLRTCLCQGLSFHVPQHQSHCLPTPLDVCILHGLTMLPAVLSSPYSAESGTPKSSPECKALCPWSLCLSTLSQAPGPWTVAQYLCSQPMSPKVYTDKPSPIHLSLNVTHFQPTYPGAHSLTCPSLVEPIYVRAPKQPCCLVARKGIPLRAVL